VGNFIMSSRRLRLFYVDRAVFADAWRIFNMYAESRLSFTNATSIALMRRHGIDYIVSFDRHFDCIVPRIS